MNTTPIADSLIEAASTGDLDAALAYVLEVAKPSKRWWKFHKGDPVADKNAISTVGLSRSGGVGRVVDVDRTTHKIIVRWDSHPHRGLHGSKTVVNPSDLVKLKRPKERNEL